jgi:hypothetical protein
MNNLRRQFSVTTLEEEIADDYREFCLAHEREMREVQQWIENREKCENRDL